MQENREVVATFSSASQGRVGTVDCKLGSAALTS